MKHSNENLAKNIIDKCQESSPLKHSSLVSWVDNQISWQMNDAFKMIKNINETSLNNEDKARRLIELEQNFGVPKTHLL